MRVIKEVLREEEKFQEEAIPTSLLWGHEEYTHDLRICLKVPGLFCQQAFFATFTYKVYPHLTFLQCT